MKRLFILLGFLLSSFTAFGADMSHGADNFFKSDKVTVQKVSFKTNINSPWRATCLCLKDSTRQRVARRLSLAIRWAR